MNLRCAPQKSVLYRGWLLLLVAVSSVAAEDGPPFPRIANVYSTLLTTEGAVVSGESCSLDDVARCDLLIGVRAVGQGQAKNDLFRQQLAELKKRNPRIQALQFACSAPYTHIEPNEEMMSRYERGKPFPWLMQTDQRLIAGWPGTYMLDLTCPGVVEWLSHLTVPAVQDQGYDGVFIDCLGPHFDAWACEIATGRNYTIDRDGDGKDDDREELARLWTAAKAALAGRTRELIGPEAVFMANQAHISLRDQLNGIYLEDYIDAVLEGRADWDHVIELYLDWTKTAHQPNATVLGCSSGVEPPFEGYKLPAEERAKLFAEGRPKLARMRFGLTATLMGDGFYSYDLHTRWRGQLWWYPEYDAPLGYPQADGRRAADGTWQRRFDGGLVVVNPTNWDVTISLGNHSRDISSGRTGTRFLIPRMDGRIFVPANISVETGSLADISDRLTWEGPAGVVTRDGYVVLRDGQAMAVLLNENGAVQSVCYRGRELLNVVRSVIVSDERWKDFATEDCQHYVSAGGALVLSGTRSHAQQKLSFNTTLRLRNGKLNIGYQWVAKTLLDVKAFRQSVYISPGRFGGAYLTWDGGDVVLPKTVPDTPALASGITTATIPIDREHQLAIRLPQKGQLLDDRFYRGPGYLLAFYPIAGAVPAGRSWSYSIEVEVGPRQ